MSQCHKPFQLFPGTEDSDFIEIEVKAHIRRYHRKRYIPTCHCENLPGMITAPMPPRLFNRNTLGVSVWVETLLDKYGSFEFQVGKQFAFILEKSNFPVSK